MNAVLTSDDLLQPECVGPMRSDLSVLWFQQFSE